jgi:adenylosuccinate synthase
MQKGKMNIVMGGMAGSESKGKVSAFLVGKFKIGVVAGNMSPNCGHTYVKGDTRVVTYHIPVGVMGGNLPDMEVILGPASVINPEILMRETNRIAELGFNMRNLFVDERAAVITQAHVRSEEDKITRIGSTAQGVGEARCDRLMRRGIMAGKLVGMGGVVAHDTSLLVRAAMKSGEAVVYEMGQGFDLCLYHGVDPTYCTSRNCTPMQALADMGVPARDLGDVYAVIRPYPIRVNNRDGSSGPYPSTEIDWDVIRGRCGAPVDITEYTTTTRLKRRVFEFSWNQIRHMVSVCNPTYLCLQFANYLSWDCYGASTPEGLNSKVMDFMAQLEVATGVPVAYVGTGSDHEHMVDLGIDKLE